MKINNTSVQGIYVYDSNLEFELGDFIIYNASIYICTPKTNQKTFPISPDKDLLNFTPYLATERISLDELINLYNNGIDNTDLNDKIVTSDVLCQFLKKISFGLDFSGIIDKEVLTDYVSPSLGEFINADNTEVIDLLATDLKVEYNNLTIKVSRNLISDLIQVKPNNEISDDDFKSVILKHYTYYENSEIDSFTEKRVLYRIQEVIDHVYGICLYRYAKLSDNSTENGISSWKVSSPNVDYINQLSALLIEKRTKEEMIVENKRFNFREVSFNEPNSISSDGNYYYTLNDEISGVITLTISDTSNTDYVHKNYSMTVKYNNNDSYKYPNGSTIKFQGKTIILSNNSNNRVVKLVNIYTRCYE